MEMIETPPQQTPNHARLAVAMLVVVVFGCGFALMALEMLGARLLATHFGSDIYAWGSVISIFLLALSIGYWLGGWMSVWRADGRVLAAAILLSAIGFGLIPFLVRPVNDAVFSLEIEDRWGALLSATTLFLLPSLLLGTVSPFAVRLATHDIGRSGASAGLLYSISTLGSFLGCILTSFYFVLWMKVPNILWCMAGLLALMAAIAALLPKPKTA